MAPMALETEDHARDAAFNKAMHGRSAQDSAGLMAMLKKDSAAQKAAVEDYFKHWDDKSHEDETSETREVAL
jgi:sterol 24-C-methyltransferase